MARKSFKLLIKVECNGFLSFLFGICFSCWLMFKMYEFDFLKPFHGTDLFLYPLKANIKTPLLV